MANITTLYVLHKNSDQTEGRGHSIPVGYFKNREDAVIVNDDARFYKEHGVMGTQCDARYNVQELKMHVYESADEWFDQYDENTIRDRAMAKLTHQEKEVLGLS